jgi:hypothetical protein
MGKMRRPSGFLSFFVPSASPHVIRNQENRSLTETSAYSSDPLEFEHKSKRHLFQDQFVLVGAIDFHFPRSGGNFLLRHPRHSISHADFTIPEIALRGMFASFFLFLVVVCQGSDPSHSWRSPLASVTVAQNAIGQLTCMPRIVFMVRNILQHKVGVGRHACPRYPEVEEGVQRGSTSVGWLVWSSDRFHVTIKGG